MSNYLNAFVANAPSCEAEFADIGPFWFAAVADDYSKVPILKSIVHADRAASQNSYIASKYPSLSKEDIEAMTFTDDAMPPADLIRSSSILIFKGIVYLINKLNTFFASSSYIYAYACCPFPKYPAFAAYEKVPWVFGQNIRLSAQGPPPPPEHLQGEGEVRNFLISKYFSQFQIDWYNHRKEAAATALAATAALPALPVAATAAPLQRRTHYIKPATPTIPNIAILPPHPAHLLVSIDIDSVSIALAAHGINWRITHFLQLKSIPQSTKRDAKGKIIHSHMKRFINLNTLNAFISTNSPDQGRSAAFTAVLFGSDYVKNFTGIGPAALLKVFFHSTQGPSASPFYAKNAITPCPIRLKSFIEFVIATKYPKKQDIVVPNKEITIAQATWNIEYWASCLYAPIPPVPKILLDHYRKDFPLLVHQLERQIATL